MPRWPWIERKFTFDYPPEKFPDLLERLRGTPARLEDRLRDVPPPWLTRQSEKGGWTIQQNAGHLIDLGYLSPQRVDQILAGATTLVAADMTNRRTHEADHHGTPLPRLLATFRKERAALVEKFEALPDSAWGRSAMHPRLKVPMRIVDIVCFDSEHDDYHLGRIGDLIREFRRG